jgi:very-short-patch-repair endonuclease
MRFPNSDVYARSNPHKRIEKVLDEIGLNYESEYSLPPFTIDIMLPEYWLGIEIDGPYHTKSKDQKRDKYLLEHYGLYLLRFRNKDRQSKEEIEAAVLDIIDQHYQDVDIRKKTWLNPLR